MKWFRLWTEILDDPKLAKLDDGEYRRFINLLAIACEQDKHGHIHGSIEDIAWRTRDNPDTLDSAIKKLLDLKILTHNHRSYLFPAWNKRQFKSDRSVDRWRAWKERQESTKEEKEIRINTDTDTEQSVHVGSNNSPTFAQTFDVFWSKYPKKVGKEAAKKAWSKIKDQKKVLEKIMSALAWQASSDQWTKENGKYIPNPATYLNQGRWEDEPYGNEAGGEDDDNLFLRGIREERERQARKRLGGSSPPIPGPPGDHGGTEGT